MLLALRDIDVCSALANPSELYSNVIGFLKGMCPELIHKCPFKAGEKFAINYTFKDDHCTATEVKQSPTFKIGGGLWPDGDYRVNVTIFGESNFIYYARVKNGDDRAF
jgi:hypothetical protein